MPLPSEETTPPVTKTYFGGRRAIRWRRQPVEAGEAGRALDQLAEGANLAHGGETGERCDRER